jgi:hypothetical protein
MYQNTSLDLYLAMGKKKVLNTCISIITRFEVGGVDLILDDFVIVFDGF